MLLVPDWLVMLPGTAMGVVEAMLCGHEAGWC
jgi:hypothetical protein